MSTTVIAWPLAFAADHIGRPVTILREWITTGHLTAVTSPIDQQTYVDVTQLLEVDRDWYRHEHGALPVPPPRRDADRTDPGTPAEVAEWLLTRHGIRVANPRKTFSCWARRVPSLVAVDAPRTYWRMAVLVEARRIGSGPFGPAYGRSVRV
jgi:hypothetical protein